VTYLANSSGGTDAAYRYDPFGRWLAQTGPYASANVMRFSSKPWIAHNGSNTDGLYYYGYRLYDPLTQRWLNRDPIGERGGINLYAFVANNPINAYDPLGLRGKLCVDKKCKASQLSDMRYVPEDPPVRLVELPAPGECVDVDAVYFPGFAWKVPNNARLTIKCDDDGCPSDFRYRKWPWWLGRGPKWEWDYDNDKPGPKPPEWPGDIPPYPNQPPKEETPKQ
jgi:RHS repeat-associated protein